MSREIDAKMKEIEEKEIVHLVGQNKLKQYKNFQLIKGILLILNVSWNYEFFLNCFRRGRIPYL